MQEGTFHEIQEGINEHTDETVAEKKEKRREALDQSLKELGVPENLIERLHELDESGHNDDAFAMRSAAEKIFGHFRAELDGILSPEDELNFLAAVTLHDVGKTGPLNASEASREAIIKLFTVKNIPKPATVSVAQAADIHIEGDTKEFLQHLWEAGVKTSEKMPNFWNKHARWTHEILLKYLDVSNPAHRQIIKIASSHHYLEKQNPARLRLDKPDQTPAELKDNFLIKLLILLDKYQAMRARGKQPSAMAKENMSAKIAGPEIRDPNLPTMQKILDWMKTQDQTDHLFPPEQP